jgi:hypothetical protein
MLSLIWRGLSESRLDFEHHPRVSVAMLWATAPGGLDAVRAEQSLGSVEWTAV